MTSSTEKILFRYGRALEEADFATISAIMLQAADDPRLTAQLLELDAAYRAEFSAVFAPHHTAHELPYHEESPMLNVQSSVRSNGKSPVTSLPAPRAYPVTVVLRAAILLVVLAGIVLAFQPRTPDNPITTTLIHPELDVQTGLIPPDGYPVITPGNADHLAQVAQWGDGAISTALWSPDSRTIALVGYGVRFLDADTLEPVGALDTGTYITSAAYNSAGTQLATGCFDGTLRVYEIATGREVLNLAVFEGMVGSLAYSPDDTLVAVGATWDSSNDIRVWEVATGRERLTLSGLDGQVFDLAFNADGSLLAAAGAGNYTSFNTDGSGSDERAQVLVWNTLTAELEMRLGGADQSVDWITFVLDSDMLIGTSWDGKVYEWWADPSGYVNRLPDRTLLPEVEHINGVAFSPDGQLIVTHDLQRVVSLWQGEELRDSIDLRQTNPPSRFYFLDIAFNPAGDRVLLMDNTHVRLEVWTIDENLELARTAQTAIDAGTMVAVAISYQNDLIAAGGNGGLQVWDTTTGQQIPLTGLADGYVENYSVEALDFSPVDNTLAVGSGGFGDSALLLWQPGTQAVELRDPDGRYNLAKGVQFDGAGMRLFTSTLGPTIQLWDVARGKLIKEYEEPTVVQKQIRGITAHPSGEIAVFWDNTRLLRRWDPDKLVELDPLLGHSAQITTAVFSLDGRVLVSLDYNDTLIVWDTTTWEEIGYITAVPGDWCNMLAVSPDGQLAAVGNNQGIIVIDLATQQPIVTLYDVPAAMLALAFSDDGTLLAGTGFDGLVRVWAVPE